jgi:hypothetical protein
MAPWFTAVSHPLTVRDWVSRDRMAQEMTFGAACSRGKEPLISVSFVTGMASVVLISGRALSDVARAASIPDGGAGA